MFYFEYNNLFFNVYLQIILKKLIKQLNFLTNRIN